jgi:hypothetical protein
MTGLDFEFEDDVQEESFQENLTELVRSYLHPGKNAETYHDHSDRVDEVYAEIYRKVGRQEVEEIYGEFSDYAITNGNGVSLHKSERELAMEVYNQAYEMMD